MLFKLHWTVWTAGAVFLLIGTSPVFLPRESSLGPLWGEWFPSILGRMLIITILGFAFLIFAWWSFTRQEKEDKV